MTYRHFDGSTLNRVVKYSKHETFSFLANIITLRAKLGGAVYCYRSCLFATGGRAGGRAGGVCYHDNSKLRALIFTKLGL